MAVYLALGDSISIDDYTGVRGGGAPSQLAGTLGLDLVDLTRDGNTTQGVLTDLARAPAAAAVVTLTAGGNDLLLGHLPRAILRRLQQIAEPIQLFRARVVVNTIYDPSDGDNDAGQREMGLSRFGGDRAPTAAERGQRRPSSSWPANTAFCSPISSGFFHGHGVASDEPWFVNVIEPNLAGAHRHRRALARTADVAIEPQAPEDRGQLMGSDRRCLDLGGGVLRLGLRPLVTSVDPPIGHA
jgi:hypothetical protein